MDIEPCRRCGSTGRIEQSEFKPYGLNMGERQYRAVCPSCGFKTIPFPTGQLANGHVITDNEAVRNVITRWNNGESQEDGRKKFVSRFCKIQ